ncbi:hypothetical protein L1887_19869 [Cichorium endivia]|nr:hypothetical protein L1887_19869 [Cichorium endivia]
MQFRSYFLLSMVAAGLCEIHGDRTSENGALSDCKKSTIMERCVGVNFPYQTRFMVTGPLRRAPLWYLRIMGCCVTSAEKDFWKTKMVTRKIRRVARCVVVYAASIVTGDYGT